MTIKECIDIVDNAKPNQYTIKEKVMWLSFIDEKLINEVLKTHEGYDGRYDNFEGYSEDKLSVVLIAKSPYDKMYPEYLKMQIDRENGETARYNNSASIFNSYLLEYRKWYNKTHMPLDYGKKKPFSPSPNNINSGLTDAEYENLKKDMTYILTEYFNDAVSEDKLNDAITKYAQNNLDMLKGKDGYTPKKGTDYFTEEEINILHAKFEEKINNSTKAISSHLEAHIDRVSADKEDTSNKVDAFVDAEDDFEAYPSVFGVRAYGDQLKAEINERTDSITDNKANREELPKKISDLVDDSEVDKPLNYAKFAEESHNAIYADRAIHDEQGFKFPEYYASKYENAKKLDREWHLLGEDEITQADIDYAKDKRELGVSFFGVQCGNMSDLTEIKAHIIIPKDTEAVNTASKGWQVGLSDSIYVLDANGDIVYEKDENGSLKLDEQGNPIPKLNYPNEGHGYALGVFGYPEFNLNYEMLNRFVLTSTFIDGYHVCTEIVKDNYGGYKSYMGGGISGMDYTDRNYHPLKIEGKMVYWFISRDGSFFFPKGSKIKIYGR